MNAVDLASLLCSRLCHDLMSPVGALNNGIELLADEHGVSLSVVREAVTRLASEDLVDATPQRGFRVRSLSLDDLRDLEVPTLVVWGMKDKALLPSQLKGLDALVRDQIMPMKTTFGAPTPGSCCSSMGTS